MLGWERAWLSWVALGWRGEEEIFKSLKVEQVDDVLSVERPQEPPATIYLHSAEHSLEEPILIEFCVLVVSMSDILID